MCQKPRPANCFLPAAHNIQRNIPLVNAMERLEVLLRFLIQVNTFFFFFQQIQTERRTCGQKTEWWIELEKEGEI